MLASIPLCPVRWNDFSKCLYRGKVLLLSGDASALGTHCRAPGSTHNTSVAQGAWEKKYGGLDQNGWYNHYFILCYFASDEIKLKVIKINFKKKRFEHIKCIIVYICVKYFLHWKIVSLKFWNL
jgi:hypothetical protein